jgi:hypothetical protein
MMKRHPRPRALFAALAFAPIAAAAAMGAGSAFAQAASSATAASAASAAHRHLDPGAPSEAVRRAARAESRALPAATGATLNAQVEAQLRGSFDAADRSHRGALTRAEAQAGGFGYVAQHFDAIDTRHAGEVTFDDLERYLRSRGARYVAK